MTELMLNLVVCGFTDPNFHLLIRDEAAVFDVVFSFSHSGEKCDLVGDFLVIGIVRQPVNRLKNLIFNAHDARLAEMEAVRNAGK
jgi:hypothetical protein